jgi:lipopolysaccharide/colanic/teichoic acid biosynthesis glycosyltransferase
MHGVFNQSWTSVLSASLVTLRRSFSDESAPVSRADAIRPRGRSRARLTRSSRRAVSARREGRAARGLQSADRARRVISEELFKDVLLREWKRAERFSHPFVLLLVELHEDESEAARGWDHEKGRERKKDSELAARIPRGSSWGRVVSALGACTRQTDVMGWFVQNGVLAVIMTEVGQADQDAMAGLEALIRRQLADRLSPEVLSGLVLEMHVHHGKDASGPEGPRPADPLLLELCLPRNTSRVREAVKRAMDIAGSLAFLIALSPIYLTIAALVKLWSPGPIFFRQVRVGQGAQPFTMFKFRTMYVDADRGLHHEFVTKFIQAGSQQKAPADNEIFKIVNDPRVTSIGRILRRTSLDELPQMWNVLRGDMSLVGPRPPLAYELEQYRSWHWRRVLEAKPGITGLWQVVGRSRTSFDDMVRLDLRYVRTCSPWTDVKILLATPRAVFSGKGAC